MQSGCRKAVQQIWILFLSRSVKIIAKKTINFIRRVALLNQERNLFCEHCFRDEKTIQLLRSLGRKLNLTYVVFSRNILVRNILLKKIFEE